MHEVSRARSVVAFLFAFCGAGWAQWPIDPAKISEVARLLDHAEMQPLRCDVYPLRPRINFGFRFQAGYAVTLPLNQYNGAGHGLAIVLRITPEDGGSPSYLASGIRLPNVLKTKNRTEFGGWFLVGEGRYHVDWMMFDDRDRMCRKSWSMEARPTASERSMNLGLAAGAVAPITFRRWSSQNGDVPTLRRLTVWLHAAPMFARSTRLRGGDRSILLGSLAALLESLPAKSVRLVVFNLDQQKELFRNDELTPESFDDVVRSMNNLQLSVVDYNVLKNRRGHVDLLSTLLNEELQRPDPSDAVVLLGPGARYFDKLPAAAFEERHGDTPHFFYFQFRPYMARAEATDSLEFAIRGVKGKTNVVRTAQDFARAIRQVQAQVTGTN